MQTVARLELEGPATSTRAADKSNQDQIKSVTCMHMCTKIDTPILTIPKHVCQVVQPLTVVNLLLHTHFRHTM